MDLLAKIGAALPKTDGANGLNAIAADLLAEPEEIHYLVIAVDCGSVNTTYKVDDFGEPFTETIPSARIRAIEPLDGGDAKMARRAHGAGARRAHRPACAADGVRRRRRNGQWRVAGQRGKRRGHCLPALRRACGQASPSAISRPLEAAHASTSARFHTLPMSSTSSGTGKSGRDTSCWTR